MLDRLKCHTLLIVGVVLTTLISNLSPAQAVILYSNREQPVGFVGADFDNEGGAIEYGEGFGLSTDAHITQILWSGKYGPNNTRTSTTDNFSVRIFNITGSSDFGMVETSLLAILTGNIRYTVKPIKLYRGPVVNDVYFYTLSLTTPFSLPAGGYLLSIMNDTSADLDDNWGWTLVRQGGALFTYDPSEPWNMLAGGLDFAIKSTPKDAPQLIPGPALLPGLLGFGLSVWRKHKLVAKRNEFS